MADVTLSSAMDTFLTGGILTVTQGTANAGVMASTGYSLTGSNATNMFDLAGTWNTSGTPTAIKLNITDTASNAASLLMDLQVGAASKFKVAKDGTTTTAGPVLVPLGSGSAPGIAFSSSTNTGMYYDGGGSLVYVVSGTAAFSATTSAINGKGYGIFGVTSATAGNVHLGTSGLYAWGTTPDLSLSRPAASVLKIGGANGGGIKILQATTTLSGVTGASVTATNLVPARAQVIGVATRVTTELGAGSGTTGYTVGDGSDADRFGAVTGVVVGTDTDSSTDATADPRMTWSASAQNIVITAAGGNFDGTGAIRVEVYYLGDTAPTA